jgi:hypothetical protein
MAQDIEAAPPRDLQSIPRRHRKIQQQYVWFRFEHPMYGIGSVGRFPDDLKVGFRFE